MVKKSAQYTRLAFVAFALALLAGCYQVSSTDSDLRTVPVTNNPHVIQDPNRTNQMTSMGY